VGDWAPKLRSRLPPRDHKQSQRHDNGIHHLSSFPSIIQYEKYIILEIRLMQDSRVDWSFCVSHVTLEELCQTFSGAHERQVIHQQTLNRVSSNPSRDARTQKTSVDNIPLLVITVKLISYFYSVSTQLRWGRDTFFYIL